MDLTMMISSGWICVVSVYIASGDVYINFTVEIVHFDCIVTTSFLH